MPEYELTLPELHKNQQTVKDDQCRFRVLNCGRRFGKDVLLIDLVVEALLEGKIVGWGSPTYKNLEEAWRTFQDILAPITSHKSEQDHRIEVITGGVLEMWSLEHPSPIRGRRYHLFLINEASFVAYLLAHWNKIIRPTLVDFHGKAIFASTPTFVGSDFHRLYSLGLGGDPEWKSFRYTSYDNPLIDPAEIDSIKATTSEDEFNSEYLAIFIEGSGQVFRNLDAVLLAPSATPAEHRYHTIVGGIDWGQSFDYTCVSLGCVECRREVLLDRWRELEYDFQLTRLEGIFHDWGLKRAKVELNSIGTPLFERLVKKGLPVVGFTMTNPSKSTLIKGFSLGIERTEIMLLPDEAGRAELQVFQGKITPTGLMQYSAPSGFHDDTIIARALMYNMMKETPVETTTTVAQQAANKVVVKKIRTIL